MEEDISLENYKKAYRKIRAEEEKQNFSIHLAVYILINIMLGFINFYYTPGTIWFIYPAIGWGIGVFVNYLQGVRWIEKNLEEKESKAEYRARKKRNNSSQ